MYSSVRIVRWIQIRPIVLPIIAALACFFPCRGFAQSILPVQWAYSSVNEVECVAYSPDGTMYAVGGVSGIQIYSSSTNSVIRCLATAATSNVSSVAFSPDSKTIAVGGKSPANIGGILEIWSISSGSLIDSLPSQAIYGVQAVAFTADGKRLADCGIGTYTGELEVWNVASATLFESLSTFVAYPSAIALSLDSKTLAIGGSDNYGEGTVEIWDIPSGMITSGVTTSVKGSTYGLALTPDGKTLATGARFYDDGTATFIGELALWDVATGSFKASLPTTGTVVSSIAISPDGKVLADNCDGYIELWNLSTTALISNLNAGFAITSDAFSPDGKTLLLGGLTYIVNPVGSSPGDVGNLQFWDVSTQIVTQSVYSSPYIGLTAAAFSSDGTTAAGAGYLFSTSDIESGALNLWNTSTGKQLASLNTSASLGVKSVAFSPSGSTLASGGQNTSGGVLELWNPSTGNQVANLPTTSAHGVTAIAYSADGSLMATGGTNEAGGVLELWNTASNKLNGTLSPEENRMINAISFAPDGTILAIGGQNVTGSQTTGLVELWNPKTGSRLTTLSAPGVTDVYGLAFSPDGSTLATCGNGFNGSGPRVAELQLWNIATGKLTASVALASGTTDAYNVSFSNDGRLVFVGTSAGIQVVSLASQTVLTSFSAGFLDASISSQITPSGNQIGFVTSFGSIAVSPNPYVSFSLSSISLNPSTVQGGDSSIGTVTLASPASSVGATVSLASSSQSVTVPAAVIFAPGATTATFTTSTKGVDTPTSVTLTVGTGSSAKTTSLIVNPSALASVSFTSPTVTGGDKTTGTVTLGGDAGPNGVIVNLASSSKSATVPKSVTIEAGQKSATFSISTLPVTKQTFAVVTANSGQVDVSASLAVDPPAPAKVAFSPSTVVGTLETMGTVTLTSVAPHGGLVVRLSSNAKSATVNDSITVAAGKTSATFTVKTHAVSTQQSVTITATLNGLSQKAVITITPPSLTSLAIAPASINGGISATASLKLNAAAPAGGIKINLASSSSSASVKTPIVIAEGRTSATFVINTSPVANLTNVTITASQGTLSKTATLAIQPPGVKALSLSPTSVKGGKSIIATLVLTSPASATGALVAIKSNSAFVVIPTSVTVLAGKSSTTFLIKTAVTTSKSTSTIEASINGTTKSAVLTILP